MWAPYHRHHCGPFYQHGITLILSSISNYTIHYKAWDDITYQLPNINGARLGMDKLFTPHHMVDVITFPCRIKVKIKEISRNHLIFSTLSTQEKFVYLLSYRDCKSGRHILWHCTSSLSWWWHGINLDWDYIWAFNSPSCVILTITQSP